jgi:hypothetical protein
LPALARTQPSNLTSWWSDIFFDPDRAQYAADPAQTQRARPGPGPALGRLRHGRRARPGLGRVMVADPAAPRSACVVLTGAPLGTTLGLASLRAARRKRRRPRRKPSRQEGEEARRAKIEARRPKHRSRLERPLATRLSRHREPNHEPHVVGWSVTFFSIQILRECGEPPRNFLVRNFADIIKVELRRLEHRIPKAKASFPKSKSQIANRNRKKQKTRTTNKAKAPHRYAQRAYPAIGDRSCPLYFGALLFVPLNLVVVSLACRPLPGAPPQEGCLLRVRRRLPAETGCAGCR